MVYVVLDYYTCGAGLYGYCGTGISYMCGVSKVTVVLYYYKIW